MVVPVFVAAALMGGGGSVHLSNRSVFKNLSRGDVPFPHDRHYEWGIGCLSCHHNYKNGTNVLGHEELKEGSPAVSCTSCHEAGRDLERAYHRLCITCHEKMSKGSISSGPVMCGLCHLNKER